MKNELHSELEYNAFKTISKSFILYIDASHQPPCSQCLYCRIFTAIFKDAVTLFALETDES
jgi:hypothetical protein